MLHSLLRCSDQATVVSNGAGSAACRPTTEDENEAIARRWHEEAINQRKLDVIDEIVASDVLHRSVTFTDLTGPAGVKQKLAAALTAFPDLHYTVNRLRKKPLKLLRSAPSCA